MANDANANGGILSTVFEDAQLTALKPKAFYGNTSLKSVALSSCTSVGKAAFMDCSELETVDIGGTLDSFGPGVFSGCTKLSALILRSDSLPPSNVWNYRTFIDSNFMKFTAAIYVNANLVSDYKESFPY